MEINLGLYSKQNMWLLKINSYLWLFMSISHMTMRKMKAEKTAMRIHTDFSLLKSDRHNRTT